MSQPTLFDAPATRGASRQSDPATSREAARSVSGTVLRDQQALVLSAVGYAATAYEVWERLSARGHRVKENVCSKRLGELRELGMVRLTGMTRPGSSSRPQQVFALTDEGRSVR